MSTTLSILLVHQTPIIRKGIKATLERSDLESPMIYELDNLWDAKNLLSVMDCDLIILDVESAILYHTQTDFERSHLLIYSDCNRELFDLMQASGNNGYISIESSCRELVNAIEQVILGNEVYSETIGRGRKAHTIGKPQKIDIDIDDLLTSREREILDMVLEELTHDEIAERLNVSRRTVEGHKLKITQKLDVKGMIGLTKLAIESGIL